LKRRRDKRKNNVIIHGLKEPTATAADDRRKEDCDLAQEMLHKLSCDDVSINHITRLGPPSASRDAKPRPVKLDLMSTESRNRVLRNEKNLKISADSSCTRIFIHQDLTLRERVVRRMLVQELKARKQSGEPNLIIVNGRIVTKRMYGY